MGRLLQGCAMASLALAAPLHAQAQEETAPTVEALIVEGTRAAVETSIDRRSYSLADDLSAQGGSVADVLRNIPSVQVDAQGNPSLLGQGNVTVLIDGRPSSQFSGAGLGQALQAMDASQIDRIEVMTNPPAQYRVDGAGGIINLVTRRSRGAGGSGSVRLRAGSRRSAAGAVNLGYNTDRLAVTSELSFRRLPQSALDIQALSRVDPATGLVTDRRDVGRHRWTNDYSQARLTVDFDLDANTRISGSARYSANRYDTHYSDRLLETAATGPTLVLERTGDEGQLVGRGEGAVTWRRTFGQGSTLTLHADHKTYESHYRRLDLLTPAVGAGPSRRRVAWNDTSPRTTFTVDFERPLPGGELKLGYDFEYAPKRTDQEAGFGSPGGPITAEPDRYGLFFDTETINEAYVSLEGAFGDLTLLGGLRAKDLRLDLEQQPQAQRVVHDYARLYPNLRLVYDLGEGRQLKASFSRRTNVPYSEQLNPLPLSQSTVLLEAGNPDLRPEDAFIYELSYEARRGDRSTIATLFYRETRDAFSVITTELPDATVLQTTVNAGAIRRAGGEWSVSGKLAAGLGYNLSLDAYWIEIAAANLGLAKPRSSVTGFGRASLNWRATPRDFLQLNLSTGGKALRPRGFVEPTYSGSIGYRRVINDNLSWTLVIEDPFHTLRYRTAERINGVDNRRLQRPSSRTASLALVWTFAGKAGETGFDFGSGDGGR